MLYVVAFSAIILIPAWRRPEIRALTSAKNSGAGCYVASCLSPGDSNCHNSTWLQSLHLLYLVFASYRSPATLPVVGLLFASFPGLQLQDIGSREQIEVFIIRAVGMCLLFAKGNERRLHCKGLLMLDWIPWFFKSCQVTWPYAPLCWQIGAWYVRGGGWLLFEKWQWSP